MCQDVLLSQVFDGGDEFFVADALNLALGSVLTYLGLHDDFFFQSGSSDSVLEGLFFLFLR